MLMLAGEPAANVAVPPPVQAVAAGRRVRPVWENELGGLTFEVGGRLDRCFVKWAPRDSGLDLAAEAVRLRWAGVFTVVPRVLALDGDDAGSWMVTAGLPGESAVSERWRADPARAVAAIGHGLRLLHDTLPVAGCPFSWSAEIRLADAHRRADAGQLDPTRWHKKHQHLSVHGALQLLAQAPPVDRLVVCHGDPCAPNTLLADDGACSGHVDLGALGVADRWADLAMATWSTEWNYGPGWEDHLLAAYGTKPDPARTAYYRLLWDVGP